MHFRSVAELNDDVLSWGRQLPSDVDLFVGLPRSGMLVATLLSLQLDRPLAEIGGFLRGEVFAPGRRTRGRHGVAARHALVVDDSILTGDAMREARAQVGAAQPPAKVSYGAVYTDRRTRPGLIDFSYTVLPSPRVFEWNVLHHNQLPFYCMDIDGVLCRDPLAEENDDGPRYERFLDTVPARLVPGEEVGWLVTSRLEKHRARTEAWLAANGVRYGALIMHPATSGAERMSAGDHAQRKAAAYLETGARLFIESEIKQARDIARLSGRSVYNTDTRTMVQPPSWRAARRVLADLPETVPAAAREYLHRVPNVPGRLRRTMAARRVQELVDDESTGVSRLSG